MAETKGCEARRYKEGFHQKYIFGKKGIDIGCGKEGGYEFNPIATEDCFHHDISDCDAHDMDIFKDEEFEYVYASHVLEHLGGPIKAIRNWYRITKTGGYLIIAVPSLYRYEKKLYIPVSRWNPDHKRGYTPSLLMSEIEKALTPNTYLVEYLKDCADGYDWSIPPEIHSGGEYQIELVIQKIKPPTWTI